MSRVRENLGTIFLRSFQYFEILIDVYCLFFRYVKSLKSPVFNFFQQGVSSKSTVYACSISQIQESSKKPNKSQNFHT